MITESCPAPVTLRRFLTGELPLDESSRLERHFVNCESCLLVARETNLSDPLVNVLSERNQALSADDSGVRQFVQRVFQTAEKLSPASASKSTVNQGDRITQAVPFGKSAEFLSLRYQSRRFHAGGGMGRIWLAHDGELSRDVAIKEIHPELAADRDIQRRFHREAILTGQLQHPGIVPVYGLGISDSGRPFYAMKFVEGVSLRTVIDEFHETSQPSRSYSLRLHDPDRQMAFRQLLQRIVSVCQTLQFAHDNGVIHRDLKPANILLGEYGETLVVDWGLAKRIGTTSPQTVADQTIARTEVPALENEDDRSLSQGTILGTPGYMSPEQFAGQAVSPATEIYSVGVMLYQVLCGQAPFETSDLDDLKNLVAESEFVSPRMLVEDVSTALESICLKAMSVKASDRYDSMKALADDLERWMADEPVSAHPDSMLTRFGRWQRRHRAIVATAGVALLVLALGASLAAGVLKEVADREQEQRLLAEGRWDELQRARVSHFASRGAQELEKNNVLEAVPYLARAFQLAKETKSDTQLHRWRLASAIENAPRLVALMPLKEHEAVIDVSADGRHVLFRQQPPAKAARGDEALTQVGRGDNRKNVLTTYVVKSLFGPPQNRFPEVVLPDDREVSLSDNGRVLMSWRESELALYDVASGKRTAEWLADKRAIRSARLSSDGQRIIVFNDFEHGDISTFFIIEAATTKTLATHRGSSHFSDDLRSVLRMGETSWQVFDAITGEAISPLVDDPHYEKAVLCGGNQMVRVLGAEAESGQLVIHDFDVRTGVEIEMVARLPARVAPADVVFGVNGQFTVRPDTARQAFEPSLAFNRRPRELATGFSADGDVQWTLDEQTGDLAVVISDHDTRDGSFRLQRIARVFPTSDGLSLVTQSWDASEGLRLWTLASRVQKLAAASIRIDEQSQQKLGLGPGRQARVRSLDSDQKLMTSVLRLHSANGATGDRFGQIHSRWPSPRSWCSQRNLLAICPEHDQVQIIDTKTGKPHGAAIELKGFVNFLEFSPDGSRLAIGLGENCLLPVDAKDEAGEIIDPRGIRVWDVIQQRFDPVELMAHANRINYAEWSRDGQQLVSVCRLGTVCVWNAATGKLTSKFVSESRRQPWKYASFDRDGRRLAIAGDCGVRVVDLMNGETVCDVDVPQADWIRFSPDDQRLIVAKFPIYESGLLVSCDSATGRRVTPAVVLTTEANFTRIALSDDGTLALLMTNDPQTLFRSQVWHLPSGEAVTPLFYEQTRQAPVAENERLLFGASGEYAAAWRLPLVNWSDEDLLSYAASLAGGRFDEIGNFVSQHATLSNTTHQLRERYPSVFVISPDDRQDWHERVIGSNWNQSTKWFTRYRLARWYWHLAELLSEQPANANAREWQLQWRKQLDSSFH